MGEIKTISVERGATTLPTAGNKKNLFTVSDYIRVHKILGVVTTDIQAQANDMKLVATGTTGAAVDLCVAGETNNDAAGTMYSVTGDFSDALIQATSSAMETDTESPPFIVAPGYIDVHCAATNTGAIKWTLIYSPVMASATVSAS